MSPAVQVHVHIPTWLAVVAVVLFAAWVLWDVTAGQVIRDQVDAASEQARRALDVAGTARVDARRAIAHLEDADAPSTGRHGQAADTARPRPYPRLEAAS